MSMAGYTKLFNSILASTIWRASDKTRIVWITLLAMADKDGIAEGSIPGLADLARVSVEDCEAALAELMQPDKYSRTTEFEGRRIETIDGGWQLLNHAKYRTKMSEDDIRERNRQRQARWRERKQAVTNLSHDVTENNTALHDVTARYTPSRQSRHTEADTKEEKKLSAKKADVSVEEQDFKSVLQAYQMNFAQPTTKGTTIAMHKAIASLWKLTQDTQICIHIHETLQKESWRKGNVTWSLVLTLFSTYVKQIKESKTDGIDYNELHREDLARRVANARK